MKRYETSSTYAVRGRYSPGILLYTSPTFLTTNHFGAGNVAGRQFTDFRYQRRAEKDQHQR